MTELEIDQMIKQMVDRFLSWKLPETFSPDAGISFEPRFNVGTPYEMRHQPIGTNLFDAREAEQMVRHMIEGLPALSIPSPSVGDGVEREDVGRVLATFDKLSRAIHGQGNGAPKQPQELPWYYDIYMAHADAITQLRDATAARRDTRRLAPRDLRHLAKKELEDGPMSSGPSFDPSRDELLMHKVMLAISSASVPHESVIPGYLETRSLQYYLSVGIDHFGHDHDRHEVLLQKAARQAIAMVRDSDRNPKGEDRDGLRAEHESAGPKDIAP